MRHVNGLSEPNGDSADPLDLLRINSAASELLAFALAQPPKEAVSAAPFSAKCWTRMFRSVPQCFLVAIMQRTVTS